MTGLSTSRRPAKRDRSMNCSGPFLVTLEAKKQTEATGYAGYKHQGSWQDQDYNYYINR